MKHLILQMLVLINYNILCQSETINVEIVIEINSYYCILYFNKIKKRYLKTMVPSNKCMRNNNSKLI